MDVTLRISWRSSLVAPAVILATLTGAATAVSHEPRDDTKQSSGGAAEAASHGTSHHDHMMGAGMTGGAIAVMPGTRNMMMPDMNSERGRKLFVTKGCVACHAVNGVGGHDATALDAHSMPGMMNPFDFAAKMWRMAPAMIYAQEEGLGEQILFTGAELADIVAFVHDDEEQHNFSEADLTSESRRMMNHSHGPAGGGADAHGEEIGHKHGAGTGHDATHTH